MTDLSIIVPVYNIKAHIAVCIESILKQEYTDYELLLVDDGSTDGSGDLCDIYAKKDSRIQVIHKKNGGVTSARRLGVVRAKGKYIGFIDGDDRIEADYYKRLMESASDTGADIVMTGYWEEGTVRRKVHTGFKNGCYPTEKLLLTGRSMTYSLWTKVIKRELLLRNIPLVDKRIFRGEDALCLYACMMDAAYIQVQNGLGYHYVQRQGSAMHAYDSRLAKNVLRIAGNIRKIRNGKKDARFDLQWNRVIINEIMRTICLEAANLSYNPSPENRKSLRKVFNVFSKWEGLLIDSAVKESVKKCSMEERIILRLLKFGQFGILKLYLKYKRDFVGAGI